MAIAPSRVRPLSGMFGCLLDVVVKIQKEDLFNEDSRFGNVLLRRRLVDG